MAGARIVLVVALLVLAGCTGVPVDSAGPQSPTPDAGPTTTAATDPTTTTWSVTVTRVVDGDTLEVTFPDGHTEDVRLLGVDTPEVHVANDPAEFEGIPETEAGTDWLRDWGHKASEFARTQLVDETVTIRTDPTADRRGSYGRLLVYVVHDGTSFNRALLDQGYARLYDSTFTNRTTYADTEDTAQANSVGLWGFDGATTGPPTATEHQLSVDEIHADAAGNDHENLDDEYITFTNTGETTLNLARWHIRDDADHTYVVPSGVTLAPGARVTLYTGTGENTDTALYWGADNAIWNNGGDTIIVTDDGGERVLTRSYS